jgi:hypothetical protein
MDDYEDEDGEQEDENRQIVIDTLREMVEDDDSYYACKRGDAKSGVIQCSIHGVQS